MNAIHRMACASSGGSITWDGIDWPHCERTVSKLQARIVKAMKDGRHGKVKPEFMKLALASDIKIRRHVKVKAAANPYDPQWKSYFAGRRTVVAGSD